MTNEVSVYEPTMREVVLRGEMGARFGGSHRYVTRSISEVLRAIHANSDESLVDYLMETHEVGIAHRIFVDGKVLREECLDMILPPGATVEFVPEVAGSGGGGQAGGGALLIILGILIGGPIAPVLIGVGISMLLGGLISLITPNRSKRDPEAGPSGSSFRGVSNTVVPGVPLPVVMGEMLTGSATLSVGVFSASGEALSSKQYVRILDLISAGPIEGIVPVAGAGSEWIDWKRHGDPDFDSTHEWSGSYLPSIFLDDTPIAHGQARWAEPVLAGGFLVRSVTGLPIPPGVDWVDKSLTDLPVVGWDYISGRYIDEIIQLPNDELFPRNFENVSVQTRLGENEQEPIAGFSAQEATHGVYAEATRGEGKITKTSGLVVAPHRVRFNFAIHTLQFAHETKGLLAGKLKFRISLRYAGASESSALTRVVEITKLIRSKRVFSIEMHTGRTPEFEVPTPLTISVEKLSEDSGETHDEHTSVFVWESFTEIVDQTFTYPLCALAAIQSSSESFESIPTRAYLVRGIKVRIPSNYDPYRRQYTGDWDGTWAADIAYTNNPAWLLMEVLTNREWGLGELVADRDIDRWLLYRVAKYCDEAVDTGKTVRVRQYDANNVPTGSYITKPLLEPRFVCNTVLNQTTTASQFVADMLSVFRGLLYYAGESIGFAVERDMPIVAHFNPTNVVGEFSYSTNPLQFQYTVALVAWRDPDNFYAEGVEEIELSQAMIRRYGRRRLEVEAFGTTSQTQARRVGWWRLLAADAMRRAVRYTAGGDASMLIPGVVVGIVDPTRNAKRLGGRVKRAELASDGLSHSVTAFDPIELTLGEAYSIVIPFPDQKDVISGLLSDTTITLLQDVAHEDHLSVKVRARPDMGSDFTIEVETVGLTGKDLRINAPSAFPTATEFRCEYPMGLVTRQLVAASGEQDTFVTTTPFPLDPMPEWTYSVVSPNEAETLWKVIGIDEREDGLFEIDAASYDPDIYTSVDSGTPVPIDTEIELPPPITGRRVPAPLNLSVETTIVHVNGDPVGGLRILWDQATENAENVDRWAVRYRRAVSWQSLGDVFEPEAVLAPAEFGTYEIEVVAIGPIGLGNSSVARTIFDYNDSGAPATFAEITGLEIEGQGSDEVFTGVDVTFAWRLSDPFAERPNPGDTGSAAASGPAWFSEYQVELFDPITDQVFRTETTSRLLYTYSLELNRADAMRDGLDGPRDTFGVSVSVLDLFGGESPPASLVVTNPAPPAIQSVALSPSREFTEMVITRGDGDSDEVAFWVWHSPTSQTIEQVEAAEPSIITQATGLVLAGTPGSDVFVRVAVVDAFPRPASGLNLSSEFSTTLDAEFSPSDFDDRSILARKLINSGDFDNLISDPAFSSPQHVDGQTPGDPWHVFYAPGDIHPDWDWLASTASKRSGSLSLAFECRVKPITSGGVANAMPNGPVIVPEGLVVNPPAREGDSHVFACWVRTPVPAMDGEAITIVVQYRNVSGAILAESTTNYAGTSIGSPWQQLVATSDIPAPADTTYVNFIVQVDPYFLPEARTVYFDDFYARTMLDNLAVLELDAGKITTGFLVADRIQAGEILTEKLVIGSFDNLIQDPGFERQSLADLHVAHDGGGSSSFSSDASVKRTGNASLQHDADLQVADAKVWMNASDASKVTAFATCGPGDQFYFEAWAYREATDPGAVFSVGMEFLDQDGVSVSESWLPAVALASASTWERLSHTETAPVGAALVRFGLRRNLGVGTDSVSRWDSLYARRQVDYEILAPGSVSSFNQAVVTFPFYVLDGTPAKQGVWQTVDEVVQPSRGGRVFVTMVIGAEVTDVEPGMYDASGAGYRVANFGAYAPKVRYRIVRNPGGSQVVVIESGSLSVTAMGYVIAGVLSGYDSPGVGTNHVYRVELLWEEHLYQAGTIQHASEDVPGTRTLVTGVGNDWVANLWDVYGWEVRWNTTPGSNPPVWSHTDVAVWPQIDSWSGTTLYIAGLFLGIPTVAATEYQIRPTTDGAGTPAEAQSLEIMVHSSELNVAAWDR